MRTSAIFLIWANFCQCQNAPVPGRDGRERGEEMAASLAARGWAVELACLLLAPGLRQEFQLDQ